MKYSVTKTYHAYKLLMYLVMSVIVAVASFVGITKKSDGNYTLFNIANADVPYSQSSYYAQSGYSPVCNRFCTPPGDDVSDYGGDDNDDSDAGGGGSDAGSDSC